MKNKPPLKISAKSKSWRIHDSKEKQLDDRDEYEQVRAKVLRLDHMTCQFCGFKSVKSEKSPKNSLLYSGYLEVHHLDDDHSNNSLDNLITACPFCHSVFHCGFSGYQNNAKIAFMPYLKQSDISLLFNMLSIIRNTQESEYLEIKNKITDLFSYFCGISEDVLEGLSDAGTFGSALIGLQINHPDEYEKIDNFLWGFRLIPDLNSGAFDKASEFWRTNKIWLPESQWKAILNKTLNINVDKIRKP